MTTRCLIVDDEPMAIRVIRNHLDPLAGYRVIATCASALEAFELVRKQSIDLIFLDIQMPGLSGIEFVQSLDDPPYIIFTTAYRDYALEGFELDAVDYLVKPVSLPRLLRALDRYERRRSADAAAPADSPAEASTEDLSLNVRADRRVEKVKVGDIRYIESLSDYVKIHTDKKTVVSKQRISHLEDRLAPHGFVRIHRSFLVPVERITAFTADSVQVGDQTLPVSRKYRSRVREMLGYDDTVSGG